MTQARLAAITGAARGIGRAVAAGLIVRGYATILIDRDASVHDTARALAGPGAAVEAQLADVAVESDVRRVFANLRTRHGRLDALVNNAGINLRKPLADLALDDWRRVLAVNLTGAFLCTREAADLLRAARGAVVNIASTRALMSEPNSEAYAASKGGLVALSHALAISLAPEVRVNCVSPGWIHTREGALTSADHAQHPAGRVGRPEDVAALVAYLVGPEAGFLTGANVVIDGGMTRKMIYVD
jgi:hypothetical protein